MELVAILRVLLRRKAFVGLGALVTIALALMLVKGHEASRSGIATTRVVVDTQHSQLINPAPQGADSLLWRSQMLADLVSDPSVAAGIAHDIGVPADQLLVLDPVLGTPTVAGALPRHALETAALATEPYALTVQYDSVLPVISIRALAPDRAAAARLAKAAAGVLEAAGTPQGSKTLQGFVVETVGAIKARELVAGSGRMKAIGTCIVLFALWCGGVALCPSLRGIRRGRATARMRPS